LPHERGSARVGYVEPYQIRTVSHDRLRAGSALSSTPCDMMSRIASSFTRATDLDLMGPYKLSLSAVMHGTTEASAQPGH
jgi:hypothetical protein